jgi:hypothetical protein
MIKAATLSIAFAALALFAQDASAKKVSISGSTASPTFMAHAALPAAIIISAASAMAA